MYITQGLKRALQVNRHGLATIDGDRRRTWAEFVDRIARLAGAFQNLGLETDTRVSILAYNSDRYLETFFAVQWAGGILMPLNVRLAPPEMIYMLNDAGSEILLVDEAHRALLPQLTAQSPGIRHLILLDDESVSDGLLSYEALIADADPIPDAGRGTDDVAGIFYTGGTTGIPKGVMLTHTNLVSNGMSVLVNMYDGEPCVYLHSAPMFHIADCQWNISVTVQAGTHVFMPRFAPEPLLQKIEQYQVTYCALVPTMVTMLCNLDVKDQYDVTSLRGMNYGGSPMPPALIPRARELFPNCRFFQGYGQTETSPNVSMLLDKYHDPDGPYADKIASAGQPMFTVEVRIVDEHDNEVPLGEVGEITARGPNIMAGYWNKPDETAHALRGGWMHTGDVGYMDEDGFLYIVDRVKDMIVSGGENVYSAEVESVIYQHPAVAMCAVIGVPHEKWGEAVHAIVVVKEGHTLTAEDMIAHCRAQIAGYKCPRSVDIRTDPLPMSGAAKILKRELRAPYWEGKTRAVN